MKTKRVLIVDDEFDLADVIARLLADEGYSVATAYDGRSGLVRLEEQPADLVLLDVMMPTLSGPGMLAVMRETPAFATIPVIVMSTLVDSLPTTEPLLHQAVLLKPFSHTELLEAVRHLI